MSEYLQTPTSKDDLQGNATRALNTTHGIFIMLKTCTVATRNHDLKMKCVDRDAGFLNNKQQTPLIKEGSRGEETGATENTAVGEQR